MMQSATEPHTHPLHARLSTATLDRFARANLSHVKCPRRIDFRAELPRHDTGKLYKRQLRDEYWGKITAPASTARPG